MPNNGNIETADTGAEAAQLNPADGQPNREATLVAPTRAIVTPCAHGSAAAAN